MQLVKRDNACGYQAKSEAIGTDLLLGGRDIPADKFLPAMNASFHNNEYYLDLNHIDSPMTDRTESQVDGKVMHEGGGFKHEFYPDGIDRIKWDMLFDNPASTPDTIRFRIKASTGLNFYKQTLTAQQIADGDEYVVPEAEGSYAVYIDGKRNNKYKTGKVCHIYSPYYVDEDGNKSPLLDMVITPDGDNAKMLILSDTQAVTDWKNNPIRAGHKLRLDPVLGYDTQGVLSSGFTRIRAQQYTASESGELSNINAYIFVQDTFGPFALKLGVCNVDQATGNPDGKSYIAQVEEIGLLASALITKPIAGTIVAGTKYAIVHGGDTNTTVFKMLFDDVSAFTEFIYVQGAWGGELQDPFPVPLVSPTNTKRYSMWAEYEVVVIDGKSRSVQVIPPGVKKSFNRGGSQFNKPPGIKGAFR